MDVDYVGRDGVEIWELVSRVVTNATLLMLDSEWERT